MNRFHRWFCRSDFWKTALADEILPWALKGVDLGENVLEVGPGPGLTTDILRLRAARITSIEIDSRLARCPLGHMPLDRLTTLSTGLPIAANKR